MPTTASAEYHEYVAEGVAVGALASERDDAKTSLPENRVGRCDEQLGGVLVYTKAITYVPVGE